MSLERFLLSIGGVGVFRLFGMVVDGAPNAYHLANLALEAGTLALALVAMSRHRRAEPVMA